ncbi:MAG: hypothetical protein ACKN97_04870 [Acidobacteriota bacterium]|jgi:hypothetical protein
MENLNINEQQPKSPFNQRIIANLAVVASWVDAKTGKRMKVNGVTENVGETTTLVQLEILPPVGSKVKLKVMQGEEAIIEVPTEVIRVERDPSNPLAALSIGENVKKWKEVAMTAAENWVSAHWKLNYEEEWVN